MRGVVRSSPKLVLGLLSGRWRLGPVCRLRGRPRHAGGRLTSRGCARLLRRCPPTPAPPGGAGRSPPPCGPCASS
eukprot:11209437-Lingulodinium_polyedra.AAC.1